MRKLLFGLFVLAGIAASGVLDRLALQSTAAAQANPAAADAIDAKLFAGLRWRSIGPARGGRSIAVAGSSSRPDEYYFGATGGGLWKTTDGGVTWRAVSDGFFKTSSVGAVAVAESNPDVVYAGMGEVQLRGNVIQGDGIYKSTDGGKTWTHVGLDKTMAIGRIRVHPSNPDVVYVAALGNPVRSEPRARASSSPPTAAKTWSQVLFRDDRTGAVDLAMDPQESGRAVRRVLGGVPHAAFACRAADPAAACSRPPTAARRGRS